MIIIIPKKDKQQIKRLILGMEVEKINKNWKKSLILFIDDILGLEIWINNKSFIYYRKSIEYQKIKKAYSFLGEIKNILLNSEDNEIENKLIDIYKKLGEVKCVGLA